MTHSNFALTILRVSVELRRQTPVGNLVTISLLLIDIWSPGFL